MTAILLLVVLLLMLVSAAEIQKPLPPRACWRQTGYRGPGTPQNPTTKQCPKIRPEHGFAHRCFRKCKHERLGQGSLCIDNCEKTRFKSNGVVFCCENNEVCSQLLTTLGVKLPKALAQYFKDILLHPHRVVQIWEDFKVVVEDATKLALPPCSRAIDFSDDYYGDELAATELRSMAK